MRHRVKRKAISRTAAHMDSLMRNLSAELIVHEKIETTLAKAKMLRPYVERLVTYASEAIKSKDDIKKFNAAKRLNNKVAVKEATKKLLDDIAQRFATTKGGYTRIVRVPNRVGDNALLAKIEFVKGPNKVATKGKKGKVVETNISESDDDAE